MFSFGFGVVCWFHRQLLGFVEVQSIQMNSICSHSCTDKGFDTACSTGLLFFVELIFFF